MTILFPKPKLPLPEKIIQSIVEIKENEQKHIRNAWSTRSSVECWYMSVASDASNSERDEINWSAIVFCFV